MKLTPTTPFDVAVKKISEGHPGAASIIALIHRDRPQILMDTLHHLDSIGMYGPALYDAFRKCDDDLPSFLREISSGVK